MKKLKKKPETPTTVIQNFNADLAAQGFEPASASMRKEAPWHGEDLMNGFEPKVKWRSGSTTQGHEYRGERGDYIVLTKISETYDGKGYKYKQHLVAADDPNANGEDAWVVVLDEDDPFQVGSFRDNGYVYNSSPIEVLCRPSDGAQAVEPTPPEVTERGAVLREAESLITGDRNQSYGPPTENFTNIADLWNVQFKHKLKPGQRFTATDVAVAMIHVKQARVVAQPKRDNFVDIAGYAACAWETQAERKPVGVEAAYREHGLSWEEIDERLGHTDA